MRRRTTRPRLQRFSYLEPPPDAGLDCTGRTPSRARYSGLSCHSEMKKGGPRAAFRACQTHASGHEEIRAVFRLRGRIADRAATRDALARRQRSAPLDVVHQEVERVLRVRLDELELREVELLVVLDVVAVLHFVQAVSGVPFAAVVALVAAGR